MTTLCKVHVRFGENELDLEGDKEFVLEAFRDFKNGFFSVPVMQQIRADQDIFNLESEIKSLPNPALSLAGFLREKGIKAYSDRALAIAAYLHQYKEYETFTKADIENCYREALLPKSTNVSRDINSNRQKGFIEITKEKRDDMATFYITQQGIEYVNSFNHV